MINLTKRIKKLFEGYDLSMDVHGQFICNQCTVFNTAERDDWLKHLRKYHYSAFVLLVREREDCPTALNDQPLANISDNEDDDDDETANIGTPRFEFDALTASIDSHRLASQRRFQPGRPAPNINQYCLIPQQQLQFGNTTADPLEQSQLFQRRILCGIQPSSVPHIGNYLGAIKKWIDLQNSGDNLVVMLADLHAVTIPPASLITSGIDPKRSIIYRQSDYYHHIQLSWLLSTLTTVQKVGHIPTYKSKVKDESSVPLGFFLYPVLQTADILVFKTTHLPIGENQIPHLRLCTYMIEKFYHYFKQNIFLVPQMMATETTRIRSLRHREQKMSKSDVEERSRIDIMDDEKIIQERVSNLIDIYAGMTNQSIESIAAEAQRDNLDTGALKKRPAQIIIEHFRTKRVEYLKLMNDSSYLLSIFDNGREHATEIADKTSNEVKHIMDFN
ncbi:unnamed protein product [Rotaria magnacalcarata]|uniref:tryptophan--tRNA ligase n=1 Tax=Rotaria magnacalcarata TaxID=392030 RepID=A0A816E7Y9_9BILA|nr:unnamed protein product [Rotaria magnacalcarata]